MKKFKVFAVFSVIKEVGEFKGNTESGAIFGNMKEINRIVNDEILERPDMINVDDPTEFFAEEIGECESDEESEKSAKYLRDVQEYIKEQKEKQDEMS